jgi:hypothetical protein
VEPTDLHAAWVCQTIHRLEKQCRLIKVHAYESSVM